MKDDAIGLIQIVSIVSVIWIILTRIVVVLFVDILRAEAIPYYNVSLGPVTFDLFQFLIVYCWGNMISITLMVVMIHFPLKAMRFKKYFWAVYGLFLLIQPIILTVIGVLLVMYSKNLSIKGVKSPQRSEGL